MIGIRFKSPNNIDMVRLGCYNWELTNEDGWAYTGGDYTLRLSIHGGTDENVNLIYIHKDRILDINGLKHIFHYDDMEKHIKKILGANSKYRIQPLYNDEPENWNNIKMQYI